METILLAKVFGLYMLISGVAIWGRQRFFAPVLGAFAEDRALRIVVGAIELVFGLFLVNIHNVWGTLPESIITLFAWAMLLEGAFYLVASDATVEKMIKKFTRKAWFMWGGIVAIALGLYLAGFGYGFF